MGRDHYSLPFVVDRSEAQVIAWAASTSDVCVCVCVCRNEPLPTDLMPSLCSVRIELNSQTSAGVEKSPPHTHAHTEIGVRMPKEMVINIPLLIFRASNEQVHLG